MTRTQSKQRQHEGHRRPRAVGAMTDTRRLSPAMRSLANSTLSIHNHAMHEQLRQHQTSTDTTVLQPLYTRDNCHATYKLYWSLTAFWNRPQPAPSWEENLRKDTEKDGVRLLQHEAKDPTTSQFLISTTPFTSPVQVIQSVKGRLQHLVRRDIPKAFKRNYSMHSLGVVKSHVVQAYLADQVNHHPMADPRVQQALPQFQINHPEVDLTVPRRSTHGQFTYNLHMVIVTEGHWREIRDDVLLKRKATIEQIARKKRHLLSRASVLPDHIHLALGCDLKESPGNVVLGYLNNLAHVHGMRQVFQFRYYVGTFGKYDLGAVLKGRLSRNRPQQ